MSVMVLDVETTTSNKGNPFDNNNRLCAIGVRHLDYRKALRIEHGDEPYGHHLERLQLALSEDVSLLVGFNFKFDLNWLYKYGVEYDGKVWDCQLFEHFASNMQWITPSLEEACRDAHLEGQKDKEIEAYWEQDINTDQIPWSCIERRVLSDVDITYQLYLAQLEEFSTWPKNRQNLFKLQCQDLLVLHHIERNGFYYDEEKSKEEAAATQAVLLDLEKQIHELAGDDRPNLNSDEHVSAILYGGSIKYEWQEENGVYKSGAKIGQTRYKWLETIVEYPRLVPPIDGTEAEKTKSLISILKEQGKTKEEIAIVLLTQGVWSIDKKVLGRLLNGRINQKGKQLIELLLKYSAEARSLSSYLDGLPKLIAKMNWPRNYLHGTINQTVVRTGRTSSSKPNLQNFDGDLKILFSTRFK